MRQRDRWLRRGSTCRCAWAGSMGSTAAAFCDPGSGGEGATNHASLSTVSACWLGFFIVFCPFYTGKWNRFLLKSQQLHHGRPSNATSQGAVYKSHWLVFLLPSNNSAKFCRPSEKNKADKVLYTNSEIKYFKKFNMKAHTREGRLCRHKLTMRIG